MKLIGKYLIERVNGKVGVKYLKGVKEGDTLTIEFEVDGHGGNSPQVDILINGAYAGTSYARKINELFEQGKAEYVNSTVGWTKTRPVFSYKEVN